MCIFNDSPPSHKAFIREPKNAWKVFAKTTVDGTLKYAILNSTPLPVQQEWMKSKAGWNGNPMGFHCWRSWLGAWFYRRSLDVPRFGDTYVIQRVKVRGSVFGVGMEGWWRGLRVDEMFIP